MARSRHQPCAAPVGQHQRIKAITLQCLGNSQRRKHMPASAACSQCYQGLLNKMVCGCGNHHMLSFIRGCGRVAALLVAGV